MANDLNQCNFIGRLGKDVETRHMPNGDGVSSFSIAVGWKSKDKEGVEWVNITAFGKLSEICSKYLRKGSKVFVSGRFKTEIYTDKDGVQKYTTKIIADQMQMLDSKSDSQNNDGDAHEPAPPRSSNAATSKPTPSTANKQAPDFDDMDDSIPF